MGELDDRRAPVLGDSAGDGELLHLAERRRINVERHEVVARRLQVGDLVRVVVLGGADLAGVLLAGGKGDDLAAGRTGEEGLAQVPLRTLRPQVDCA